MWLELDLKKKTIREAPEIEDLIKKSKVRKKK